MGLLEKKLLPGDFSGKNVKALPDKPSEQGITAAQLKAAFDRSGEEVIAARINEIIDLLAGNSGAANIRTAAEGSVEEALAQRLLGSGIRAIRIGESGALEYSMDGENWAIPASGGGMSGNYDAGMFSSQQTLQLKRGNQAELPALKAGEPAFCTDSGRLYLGSGTENLIAGATVTAVGEIQPEAWQGESAPYTVVYTPPVRARRFCEIQPDCSALNDTQAAELLGCGIIAGESTDSGVSLRAMYAKPNFRIPLELRYHD